MPEIIGGKWKTLRMHVGIIPQIDHSEGAIFFSFNSDFIRNDWTNLNNPWCCNWKQLSGFDEDHAILICLYAK